MTTKINEELWEKGEFAENYPKDWIVIPVLEVIEILNKGAHNTAYKN